MMPGIRPSTDYSLLFQTIRLPFSPTRTVFPRPKRAGIPGLAIADTSTSLARAEYAKGFRRLAESHAGGLDGDRTHDLLFRRQTLYPLSYKPEQLLYCTPHHVACGTYVAKITRKSPLSALQWGYVGTYR